MHNLLDSIIIDFDLDPLIDAINARSSVIYVGAGASIPVGLPTWRSFLIQCIHHAKKAKNGAYKWRQAERSLREGDYLTCADLIQNEIGHLLERYVWDTFGHASTPSLIHQAISRVPFSLAVTTNYDRLLESAYPNRPNVWTWRDPEAIFSSLKHGRFAVVKMHGDVGNGPSLVLTKTQYRDLMHLNRSFNNCLSTILSLNTFLFIGSSLRDHDLLRLMDDARLVYGADFGPHYAVMFSDEVDSAFSKLLRDSYNINVILCRKPPNVEENWDWRTDSVCSFLKVVSGKVSKKVIQNRQILSLDAPFFSLKNSIRSIISNAVTKTGADRGRVAFVKNLNLHGLYSMIEIDLPTATEVDSNISVNDNLPNLPELLILPDSMLGYLFVQGGNESKYVYSKNITGKYYHANFDEENIPLYESPHTDTKSVLACQILADGQRVGIMVLESYNEDAFTQDHLSALTSAAVTAGAAFNEFRHREKSSRGIGPFVNNMQEFNRLMGMSRQLRPLELSFLLYDIDYVNGLVTAKYDPRYVKPVNPNQNFSYRFEDKSLVTEVLRDRKPISIDDAELDSRLSNISISKKGVDFFGIKGSVYAVPIYVEGTISSILVSWSRSADQNLKKMKSRISRLAHVIANDPDRDRDIALENRRSYKLFRATNNILKRVDHDKNWEEKSLKNRDFRKRLIQALLKTLTHQACGLARVRIWQYIEVSNGSFFQCIQSFTVSKATMEGKEKDDAYVGITTDALDPYCKYTLARYAQNPFALHQHSSMFGKVDKNSMKLDKDPSGSWIVGPIVSRHGRLLGFIAADNHYPVKDSNNPPSISSVEKHLSERDSTFQRFAVDVISDLLAPILIYNLRFQNK